MNNFLITKCNTNSMIECSLNDITDCHREISFNNISKIFSINIKRKCARALMLCVLLIHFLIISTKFNY